MKKYIWLCCIILFVAVCSSRMLGYQVRTTHDEFDGYTKNTLQVNELSGGTFGANIHLLVQRFETKEGKVLYHLIVYYWGENWLFIQEDESLILLVDNERIGFTGDGSSSHRNASGSGVREYAYYETTAEVIKKIAEAGEVKVKIIGSQLYCERHFSDHNFNNFRKFIAQFIPD